MAGLVELDNRIYEMLAEVFDNVEASACAVTGGGDSRVADPGLLVRFLSHMRANCIVPFVGECESILEVGSGVGEMSFVLAENSKRLVCVEEDDKKRALAASRYKYLSNVEYAGDLCKVSGSFDIITLAGGEIKVDAVLLASLKERLKPCGRIIWVCDNRYGLDRFANAPENVASDGFTIKECEGIIKSSGFTATRYYLWPDRLYTLVAYSDVRLPHCGELVDIYRNFDAPERKNFEKGPLWDQIIRDGKFPEFANSYVYVLDKGANAPKLPDFVKLSNDRAADKRIITSLEGGRVFKRAANVASRAHIQAISKAYDRLAARYEGFCEVGSLSAQSQAVIEVGEKSAQSQGFIEAGVESTHSLTANASMIFGVCFNKILDITESRVEFEFLDGVTLEETILGALACDDKKTAVEYIKKYSKFVRYNKQSGVWDIDLIFKNIIIDRDDVWNVLDFEWTVEDTSDLSDFIIQRAVYYFLVDNPGAARLSIDWYGEAGVAVPELTSGCYEKDVPEERKFQQYVMGDHRTLSKAYETWGKPVWDCGSEFERSKKKIGMERLTVDDFRFKDERDGELHHVTVDLCGADEFTLYPAQCGCIVYVKSGATCAWHNGLRINTHLYVMDKDLPTMRFRRKKRVDAQSGADSKVQESEGAPGEMSDTAFVELYVLALPDSPVFFAVAAAFRRMCRPVGTFVAGVKKRLRNGD